MNDWEPGSNPDALRARAGMLSSIRAFFAERNVMEVCTPVLAAGGIPDPNINAMRLRHSEDNAGQTGWILQSSPESAMKRLLAAGSGPIYQICPAFRAGEAGTLHNPEFSILEWYRPGFDQDALINELAALLTTLGIEGDAARKSYQQLFEQYLQVDPISCESALLAQAAKGAGLQNPEDCNRDELLDFLLSTQIAPRLGHDGPVFIQYYPASQAALARISEHDSRVCERFELFLGGLEIANGYDELLDAEALSRRFGQDNATRRLQGQEPLPVDQRLLKALASGMPACSGVALGLDRLLMCLLGSTDIDSVMAFSASRVAAME